jgi:hypothetical protein
MLRWFWWRINAWSEIVSMAASLTFFLTFDQMVEMFGFDPVRSEVKMLGVAILTMATWLLATYLTPPESDETLDNFFKKVHPGGPGWKPVAKRNPDTVVDKDLGISIVAALFATGIVYSILPAIGNLIFGHYTAAIGCGAVSLVCTIVVAYFVNRLTKS